MWAGVTDLALVNEPGRRRGLPAAPWRAQANRRKQPMSCSAPGLMEALSPREDQSHGSTEEVPGGASGASGQARGGNTPLVRAAL